MSTSLCMSRSVTPLVVTALIPALVRAQETAAADGRAPAAGLETVVVTGSAIFGGVLLARSPQGGEINYQAKYPW